MVLASVALTIIPGTYQATQGCATRSGWRAPDCGAGAAVGHTAVARMHPGLGGQPSMALPAFQWRVRLQIKWVAFAASFVGLAYGITLVGRLFLAPEALATKEAPLWMALLQNMVLISTRGSRLPWALPCLGTASTTSTSSSTA